MKFFLDITKGERTDSGESHDYVSLGPGSKIMTKDKVAIYIWGLEREALRDNVVQIHKQAMKVCP